MRRDVIVAQIQETEVPWILHLIYQAVDEMGLQSMDYEANYVEYYENNCEEDVESMGSAIFELQNFVDAIIQFVGEEIENLRSLVEKVDRTD